MEINAQECLNQNDNFACQSNIGSTLIKGVRPGVAPKFSIVIPNRTPTSINISCH